MATPSPHPSLAVSLSSAFLGFHTHAGFLQGLTEGDAAPGHLAGASSGALVGALAANGMTPQEIFEVLLSRRFRTVFIEPGMFVAWPFIPIHDRIYSGATKGHRILRFLKDLIGDQRLEDTRIPMAIAVTNLSQVRAEIRSEGPLAELIVGSLAYPTIISHQIVDGDALWDGGVAHSPPFAHWVGVPEVQTVLAHCIGAPVVPNTEKLGISAAFALAHDIIGEELYDLRRQQIEAAGKSLHRVITDCPRPRLIVTEKAAHAFFEHGRLSGLQAAKKISSAAPSAPTAPLI